MVESYLKHTPYTIHIVTNVPDEFTHYGERLIVDTIELTEYDETVEVYDQLTVLKHNMSVGRVEPKWYEFDYTHKIRSIIMASKYNYDVTYYMDCDVYTEGWDDESFQSLCSDKSVDIWSPNTIKNDIKTIYHRDFNFGWYDKFDYTHKEAPRVRMWPIVEHRVIFTNKRKLKAMIKVWEKYIPLMSQKQRCCAASDGRLLAVGAHEVKANICGVTYDKGEFCQYEKVDNRGLGEVVCRDWLPPNKSLTMPS